MRNEKLWCSSFIKYNDNWIRIKLKKALRKPERYPVTWVVPFFFAEKEQKTKNVHSPMDYNGKHIYFWLSIETFALHRFRWKSDQMMNRLELNINLILDRAHCLHSAHSLSLSLSHSNVTAFIGCLLNRCEYWISLKMQMLTVDTRGHW